MLSRQTQGAATTAALEECMKTPVIAAAFGPRLLLVLAWKTGHDAPSTGKAPTNSGSCYAEGPGPNEPTLCP